MEGSAKEESYRKSSPRDRRRRHKNPEETEGRDNKKLLRPSREASRGTGEKRVREGFKARCEGKNGKEAGGLSQNNCGNVGAGSGKQRRVAPNHKGTHTRLSSERTKRQGGDICMDTIEKGSRDSAGRTP